ncbi:hypothetical protein [Paenibacillus ottowii]|nr:hypothetical protein [Paenibacillus ottowii]
MNLTKRPDQPQPIHQVIDSRPVYMAARGVRGGMAMLCGLMA